MAGWCRHKVERDYALQDPEHGTLYHRLMLLEGMEAYKHAKERFAAIPDEANSDEALRQEMRLVERIRVQVKLRRAWEGG